MLGSYCLKSVDSAHSYMVRALSDVSASGHALPYIYNKLPPPPFGEAVIFFPFRFVDFVLLHWTLCKSHVVLEACSARKGVALRSLILGQPGCTVSQHVAGSSQGCVHGVLVAGERPEAAGKALSSGLGQKGSAAAAAAAATRAGC